VGVPVIASSVGGIPSVIQNGHNGFLCNKGDVQSFVTAINLVYGDSNMKNQIAKNARTYAIDNISLARMNDQYLTVFRKVLTS
jgi:glycosyltransferase involved in cell wall biosynthesis